MGKSSKRSRKEVEESNSGSDDEGDFIEDDMFENDDEEGDSEDFDDSDENDEEEKKGSNIKLAEMEELEKEYMDIRHEEQDILKNLTRHKDDDLLKGQAVKNQKALWDKALELRFLLQKAFSNSNRLPQEPVRSSFCDSGDEIGDAYSDLISSSKKTLDSILELQEAILEKNPSIMQAADGQNSKPLEASRNSDEDIDEEWLQISQMHSRMASFRDKSIDKWHRKTQVTTGAAAIKGKLKAFNQDISEQVAAYMRDPSRMVKGMQQRRSTFPIFGTGLHFDGKTNGEDKDADGDPELLDDSEYYQQLLKEFFESCDSTSSETAYYALKRLHTKKRKIVDRRASKSRKIRYNIHEKIVNFMAPQPVELPPMASKLFENLFGLKSNNKFTTVA